MSLEPPGPRFETSEEVFFNPRGEGYVFGLGYVFGFGAARWLPRAGWPRNSPQWQGWRARIANLFNPFVPLPIWSTERTKLSQDESGPPGPTLRNFGRGLL